MPYSLKECDDIFKPVVDGAVTQQFTVFLSALPKERYEVEQITPLDLFQIRLRA
jgi:hypothetical protein